MKELKNRSAPITKKMLTELSPESQAHIAKIEKFMKWRKHDFAKLRRASSAHFDKLQKFMKWEEKASASSYNDFGRQFFETNQEGLHFSIPTQNWSDILDVCSWFRRNDKRGRDPRGSSTHRLGRAIWAKFFESSQSRSKETQGFILHYIGAKKMVSPFAVAIFRIAKKEDLEFFVRLGRAIEGKRREPPPDSLFSDREWLILSNYDRSAVLRLPLKYFTDLAAYCAFMYLQQKRVPTVDPLDFMAKKKLSDMYKHWRIRLGLEKPERALVQSVESSEGRLILKDISGEEVRVRVVTDLPRGRQLLQFSSLTRTAKCSSGSQCASGRNRKVRPSSALSLRSVRCSPRRRQPKP